VLRLYDPGAETELHTDACSQGLGAILLQKQKDRSWGVIAFYSQATNQAESNYHSFELEMLAIVRAVERFHVYLYGINFVVVTDCNALVYAVNKANLNPRIARWTLVLQIYNFKVTHRPGRRMSHVDALSRSVAYVTERPLERELEFRQLTDPRIKEISEDIEFKGDNENFALVDGLLYKKIGDQLKFVIPESMTFSVIRAHHDEMAHCGFEKTLQGIKQNYWFPSINKKISDYIENCLTCLMADSSTNRFEGEIQTSSAPKMPLEVWHVDHFGPLQETADNYKHILIVVDAYTRFTWLFATKSTGSKEAIDALKTIIKTFGKPDQIVSDRGTAFTSKEFSEFTEYYSIRHRKVAVAAPWANGIAERANRFLKTSLTKLINEASEWKLHLERMQYILNNTYHSSIKASPAKLMFGFEQRSHSDSQLARFTQALTGVDVDLEKIRDVSRDSASRANELVRQYNKKYCDKKWKKPTVYKEGDYVLVKNDRVKPRENAKLKPSYKGPYKIAKVLRNNRYVIQDIPGYQHGSKLLDTIMSPDRIKPWIKPVESE